MASEDLDQLRSLVKLAREKARENRRVLRDNTSDLFLPPSSRLSEREISLMSEVLRNLIRELELALRRELAARLPYVNADGEAVAADLAPSETELARPVLARHEVLRDPLLVELIKHRAHEHVLAQPLRRPLAGGQSGDEPASEADLIDELLHRPDPLLVLRTREYLVAQTAREDGFQRPLLPPAELPKALTERLVWWIAAALQGHILAVARNGEDADNGIVDDVVEDAARAVLRHVEAAAGSENAATALAGRLLETGELTPALLVRSLRQGQLALFVAGLARLCHLDDTAARRMVFDPSGEALVLASRAAGLDRAGFHAICLLTRRRTGDRKEDTIIENLLKLFDTVSEKTARRSLAYWNRNSEYMVAIEKVKN